MTLVYSRTTGLLLGQYCANSVPASADAIVVLTGRGRGAHYVECPLSAVRLEVIR